MTTFSQLVDDISVVELKRPDMRAMITSYTNQVIRDVHSKSSSRAAIFFGENRNELEITFNEIPMVWPIPSALRFQKLEAVYASQRGVYLRERNPAVIFQESDNPFDRFYYYRSGGNFVFNGIDTNEKLKLTYYQFPSMLKYYAVNDRPATWDDENQEYVVKDTWPGTEAEALDKVTHWLLYRHSEALKEGVRYFVYQRIDSENQSRKAWSNFEAMREAIHHLEGV